jgi:hypothetical protein
MVLHDLLALAVSVVQPDGPDEPGNDLDAPQAPIPGLENVAPMFIGWLKWLLMFGGVAGLLICGIMMAVGRRNRSSFAAEGAAGIPWVLGGLALGMVAASIVTGILGW